MSNAVKDLYVNDVLIERLNMSIKEQLKDDKGQMDNRKILVRVTCGGLVPLVV